jgi:hypothetical protein
MLVSLLIFVLFAILILILVDKLPMLGEYKGWVQLVVVVIILVAAIVKFGSILGLH